MVYDKVVKGERRAPSDIGHKLSSSWGWQRVINIITEAYIVRTN